MMILLAAACLNNSVKRTTGTTPDPMMSSRTCPDGGQLVDVADDQHRSVVRDRFHKRLRQHDRVH